MAASHLSRTDISVSSWHPVSSQKQCQKHSVAVGWQANLRSNSNSLHSNHSATVQCTHINHSWMGPTNNGEGELHYGILWWHHLTYCTYNNTQGTCSAKSRAGNAITGVIGWLIYFRLALWQRFESPDNSNSDGSRMAFLLGEQEEVPRERRTGVTATAVNHKREDFKTDCAPKTSILPMCIRLEKDVKLFQK